MRFVAPETVDIPLKDGPNGEKNWIRVKRLLTSGEERALRSAGFRRVSQRTEAASPSGRPEDVETRNEVDIDWAAMAFARVETYLVDWSAKKPDGKDQPVNRDTLRALHPDDFEEIDDAIKAHVDATNDEKKRTNRSSSSLTSDAASSSDSTGPGTTT